MCRLQLTRELSRDGCRWLATTVRPSLPMAMPPQGQLRSCLLPEPETSSSFQSSSGKYRAGATITRPPLFDRSGCCTSARLC